MTTNLHAMRLLDRYLLRELLLPLGYCLGGFLIFWISFDLLNEFNRFQRSNLSFTDVVEFYFVTTPELLLVVMPIALLLALLYSLTTHARHNELTAMRAAGISLWRFSAPYFAVGLFFSVAYFAINEFWVPESTDRAEAIMRRNDTDSSPAQGEWRRDLKFKNFRDNRDWAISAYNLRTSQLQGVLVEQHFPDGRREVTSAERGEFSDGAWKLYDAEKNVYASVHDLNPQSFSTNILTVADWPETPELIRSEIKISGLNSKRAAKKPQLSIRDIFNYLQLHPKLDRTSHALINTQLHGRIAAPWTCLVVVLIALPFGALSGRRNVFVGVASSIFICFSYFILLRLGLALGTGGYLPGWIAAWLPNILFGATAIWFTLRVR